MRRFDIAAYRSIIDVGGGTGGRWFGRASTRHDV
jgi:hypothetical protein